MASSLECDVIRFVTGNGQKIAEVEEILDELGLPLPLVRTNLDLDELQAEPRRIAAEKCEVAARTTLGPTMVDDTSLCLEALGDMPGPFIKWFQTRDDVLPRMLDGFESKRAVALCCVAFSNGGPPVVFEGRCEGTIVEPRGERGFGWDRCFQPDGSDLTFAEMPVRHKNKISHRANALRSLAAYLRANPDLLDDICDISQKS
ncbi:hypothetical protein CTAYLR_008359 [Chrysophaeum taylorii]|uniref:XTP/dITP diphosphatase n=1 Tax=Chrysophaeum taylorii TaxID=2483200 RepID=A0AAD7UKK2_9STRA|nr:hypothetical protein CTAYLR_008359 [Chrysophaeum taylorii]